MQSRRWTIAAVASALLSLAPAARADLLTSNVPSGTATFTFSGIPSGSSFANLNNQTFYVGTLAGTLDGLTFPMYCVDLNAEIHPGDTYAVNPHGDVTTLGGYDLIGRLLSLAPPADAASGAAMQLAIWDAEYLDGNPLSVPDAGTGITITTSLGSVADVFNQANSDLTRARALSGGNYDHYAYLQVPSGQYGQGMVTPSGQLTPQSVPEPSSLALLAAGGLLMAWRRRKRTGA